MKDTILLLLFCISSIIFIVLWIIGVFFNPTIIIEHEQYLSKEKDMAYFKWALLFGLISLALFKLLLS